MSPESSLSPFLVPQPTVIVVGGGPAGLMAAEVLSNAGVRVNVYDAMPTLGRKFLLAGIGGMNITHNEEWSKFITRYEANAQFFTWLNAFDNRALIEWIHGLGVETFVGSSNRVFSKDMKAAPLLRAWLNRLREQGVNFYPRHRLVALGEQGAAMQNAAGETLDVQAQAIVLALGGGSWARLGSDGGWVELLRQKGISVNDLQPSNCGFIAEILSSLVEYAGSPIHNVGLACWCEVEQQQIRLPKTEIILSNYGIEGTGVYALSRYLRRELARKGAAELVLDLLPDFTEHEIYLRLQKPQGKNSLSNFLRKQLNLTPVKLALLRVLSPREVMKDHHALARALKHLPIGISGARPIDEAISTAGGINLQGVTNHGMLEKLPGVFVAGEMLDWDAPTGGYLLTGCFATGRAAGLGALEYVAKVAV